jgi:Cu(I)/Ag(I) efflux system membrane fusion protein
MDLVPVMKRNVQPAMGEHGHDHARMLAEQTTGKPNEAETAGASEFIVPVERQQQIGVTYATVARKPLHHSIRAVGTVEPDAKRRWAFVARVEGYVQQLFVTSPGELVEKNQPLISIYSPDLLTTGRELVSLLRMRDEARGSARELPERLIAAAKSRLQQWNVTGEQIAELEKTRTPDVHLTLRSPFRGVVQEVPVSQGASVKPGDRLVDVADLSIVWVWADFYENELSMLEKGQKITVTAKSYPGENFEGEISLINPFLAEMKRTARVRMDIKNPDFKLRPGMFVNAELAMDMGEALTVPVSAVMPTGTRNVVFVDKGEGRLEPRIVALGMQYGELYEVKSGLQEGERVIASANFLIDAESKVQGALQSFHEDESGKQESRKRE